MMKLNNIHLSYVSKFAPQYFEMLKEEICMYKNKQLMNILIIKTFLLGVVDSSKKLETICMRSLGDLFICIF